MAEQEEGCVKKAGSIPAIDDKTVRREEWDEEWPFPNWY